MSVINIGDVVCEGNPALVGTKIYQVKAIITEPTVEVMDGDGKSHYIAQRLLRHALPMDEATYWKEQAEHWKKRAAQHGCNTDNGDAECG